MMRKMNRNPAVVRGRCRTTHAEQAELSWSEAGHLPPRPVSAPAAHVRCRRTSHAPLGQAHPYGRETRRVRCELSVVGKGGRTGQVGLRL